MLEMLKTRKEQLQAEGKKGFTLMEMLIVIAIIAILIAIAIPVFTSQLDNARHATDVANVRSALSEEIVNSMSAESGATVHKSVLSGAATQGATVTFENDDHTIKVSGPGSSGDTEIQIDAQATVVS